MRGFVSPDSARASGQRFEQTKRERSSPVGTIQQVFQLIVVARRSTGHGLNLVSRNPVFPMASERVGQQLGSMPHNAPKPRRPRSAGWVPRRES